MYNTYIALLASWRARFMLAGLAFTTQLRLCISRSNLVDNLDLKAYYAKVSTKYFADQLCHSPTSSRSRVLKNEWTKTPSNNVPLSPRRSSDTNRCSSWISSVHTSENLNYHPRTRDPFFFVSVSFYKQGMNREFWQTRGGVLILRTSKSRL